MFSATLKPWPDRCLGGTRAHSLLGLHVSSFFPFLSGSYFTFMPFQCTMYLLHRTSLGWRNIHWKHGPMSIGAKRFFKSFLYFFTRINLIWSDIRKIGGYIPTQILAQRRWKYNTTKKNDLTAFPVILPKDRNSFCQVVLLRLSHPRLSRARLRVGFICGGGTRES